MSRSSFSIGIALSLFPPTVGGAELLLLELARRWVKVGHPTTVFTRRHPQAPNHECIDGIQVCREIRTIQLGPAFGASFVATLAMSLRRHRGKCDVLVAFQAPWESAATGIVANRVGAKGRVAVVQQSGPFGDVSRLRQSRCASRLRTLLLRHDAFVGLSDHARGELVDLGCPPESVHVIRNGIDLGRFGGQPVAQDPEQRRTAVFVGRFTAQKNPMRLLEAWKIANRGGEYRLLLCGAGELETTMRTFCRDQRLQGVEFLGRQTDMPAVYRKGSVFVLSSLGEGCCMALLEAMAGGLCPVVTAVGGNLDVVSDGVNGLLAPVDDADALADRLRKVLLDNDLRKKLGRSAADHIAMHHDIDRVADRYLDLFDSLVRRKRVP